MPAELIRSTTKLTACFAALHSVDIERAGLSDFGRAGNYFERQIGGSGGKAVPAPRKLTTSAMNRLIEWLPLQPFRRWLQPPSCMVTTGSTT